MAVLITGSSGFVGRRLAELWPDSDEPIHGLDVALAGSERLKKEWTVDLSFECVEAITYVLRLCQPSVVIHLAGRSHIPDSLKDPAGFIAANTTGTMKLLEAVRLWRGESGVNPAIVLAGSGEEYGYGTRITEKQALEPRSIYAASKAAMSEIATGYAHAFDMDIRICRFATIYGPGQKQKFIPHVIESLLDGKTIDLHYGGQMLRSWLYVDDACRGVIAILNVSDGAFNLPGFEHANGFVAEAIRQTLCSRGHHTPPSLLNPVGKPVRIPRVEMNGGLMKQLCAWEPQTGIAQGLTQTVDAFLSERNK